MTFLDNRCGFIEYRYLSPNWSDRAETPKEWNDYRFGFGDLPTPKGCHWSGANHAILSGLGNALAKKSRIITSLRDFIFQSPQMRILERVFVLQAVAEDAVETGVTEQDRPCEHQPRRGG